MKRMVRAPSGAWLCIRRWYQGFVLDFLINGWILDHRIGLSPVPVEVAIGGTKLIGQGLAVEFIVGGVQIIGRVRHVFCCCLDDSGDCSGNLQGAK